MMNPDMNDQHAGRISNPSRGMGGLEIRPTLAEFDDACHVENSCTTGGLEIRPTVDQLPDGCAVWERLRESMALLDASQQRTSDPAALALKLAKRARLLRGQTWQDVQQPTTAYLTFSSGHERFGVLLRDVIEIQALDHYSPVPRTPPYIVGVVPWRGALLTLFDLGRLFGIREAGIADYHVCIVVEAAGRKIAIVAREVEDILAIANDQVTVIPEQPGRAPSAWFTGIHDSNRILLCLERLMADDRFANWKGATPC